MPHVTYDQLLEKLAQAKERVAINGRYVHYHHSDDPYTIVDLVIMEATDEVGVLYRSDRGVTFARPLSSWLEQVELGGKMVPRFSRIAE